jgi:hypothetical protein
VALNEAATLTFTFKRTSAGRRVHGRCVVRRNRHGRSCKRALLVGRLSFAAHRGVNTLVFQGRLSPILKLRSGRYVLVIGASDATARHAASRQLSFTIVR